MIEQKETIKKKQQQQQQKQPLVSAFQVARHLQHINFVMKPFLSFNSSLYNNNNVHVYFTSIQSKHSSYQGTIHTQMDF